MGIVDRILITIGDSEDTSQKFNTAYLHKQSITELNKWTSENTIAKGNCPCFFDAPFYSFGGVLFVVVEISEKEDEHLSIITEKLLIK